MKICVVDDEQEVRESIIRKCKGLDMDLEVLDAGFGKQALEFVLQQRPDLVLLDIHMPTMSGLELVQCLKRDLPMTQSVFVSGYNDFEYARQAIRLEISDYLLKPVDEDELFAVIQKAEQRLYGQMTNDWNEIISELKRSFVDLRNIHFHSPALWCNSSVSKTVVLRNMKDTGKAAKEILSFDDDVVGGVSIVDCSEEDPSPSFNSREQFCEFYLSVRNHWFEEGSYKLSGRGIAATIADAHRLLETESLTHLSLGWVAERLEIHPITLSKYYKIHQGISFVDALIVRKLKTACQRLLETELKVQEICKESGYGDEQFFTKQFKKKYGVTPNEFRKRHRSKNDGN
ncbi:hypothetical protein A8709_32535 [Paenibacillus pectinilyticus]|uniref:DNA-binding response regulator n=1 Tax=Paenibacillus pectinilyticus TaxID=512399 RepID=A0A1C0ZWT0_9BACL|nr:response regulator [Paenibacillus pectinilyticus]OCT12550.1 hypothetical protein A8709_32535 [Paenibacillus pectinilyticus]